MKDNQNKINLMLEQKGFSVEVQGDEDALRMTSPQLTLQHLSNELSDYNYKSAVEICCAVGLTAINLAKNMDKVYGIDIDEDRIEDAKKNAQIYGVEEKTIFIVGDALDTKLLQKFKVDVAILDPEWGLSKDSKNIGKRSLLELTNPNMKELFYKVKENITDHIVMKIPNTFTLDTISHFGKCRIDNIIYEDKIKFKYAYFLPEILENEERNYFFDL